MAKVKIQGHASGTGVLTVTAPNTSTDRTITLPDATGTLLTADGDGSSLTGVGVDGISSSADATAMTITSDENIGIGTTTPPERLSIHEPSTGTGTYLPVAITGANYATGYGVGISFKTENTSPTQKAKAAIIAEGTGEGNNKTSLHIAMSDTDDTTTEVALADSVLEFTMDGRGLSQFTAKAWVNFNGQDTLTVNDSHNVSSVTDDATAQYTVNFSNDMANDDYCAVAHTHTGSGTNDVNVVQMPSTSRAVGSVGMQIMSALNTATTFGNGTDTKAIDILIFGD